MKDSTRALGDPVLFTFSQTAQMTSLPETWLRKQVTARTIPFRKLGKHVRFAQADIDSLIASTAQGPGAVPLRRPA